MDDEPGLPRSPARRPSSTRGSPSASPSCSPASPTRSPPGSGSRSAGMWVEADMNLPSGESIVRQIVHGQRCFEEHFGVTLHRGVDPRRVRLPGRPAAGVRRRRDAPLRHPEAVVEPHQPLPALRRSGGRASTARRVLTHFPPVDTYNAEITPAELADSVDRFAEHAWSDVVADAVRLRRRRRRADARDARAAAPARRPRRHAARSSSARRREFFDARRGRGRRRGAGAGVARRAVLRDPPRHADQPAAHEARQPALRAAAPRGRAVDGDRGRRRRSTRTSSTSCGGRC